MTADMNPDPIPSVGLVLVDDPDGYWLISNLYEDERINLGGVVLISDVENDNTKNIERATEECDIDFSVVPESRCRSSKNWPLILREAAKKLDDAESILFFACASKNSLPPGRKSMELIEKHHISDAKGLVCPIHLEGHIQFMVIGL